MLNLLNKKLLIVLLLVVCLGVAISNPKVRWRFGDIVDKATLNPANVTWADVLHGMTLSPGHPVVRAFSEGAVTIQLRQPEGPCPVLWNTPWGDVWARFEDENILEFLAKEQFKANIYEYGPVRVHEGDVVVDVGAHLGTFAMAALQKGAGHVISIEPEPTNIECFKKNLEEEIAQGRVSLVEAAAWDSPGKLRFEAEAHSNSAMARVAPDGTIEVEAVIIDQVIKDLGFDVVHFLKMDIEGAERNALRGARQTLASSRPQLALCVYHRPDDPEVISEVVLDAQPDYQFAGRQRGQAYYF